MKFKTIKSDSESYYTDRGSRFQGFLKPLESSSEFRKELRFIKRENPKSTHVCSAYRIIDSKSGIQESFSDGGEPAGSAGYPMLNELKRNDIVNVAAFVIRYYGGTKLGIPGLIHSYSESVRLAILNNKISDWNFTNRYSLLHSYKETDFIDSIISKYKVILLGREFNLLVSSHIQINEDLDESFQRDIKSNTLNSITIKKLK